MNIGFRPFLIVSAISLAAIVACSPHRPASIEEQSDLIGKRLLNRDGTYSVREGDTLYAIAFHYGMDPQEIARWNGIGSPFLIHPGQKLRMMAPPPGIAPKKTDSRVTTTGIKPVTRSKTVATGHEPKPATTQEPAPGPSQEGSGNAAKQTRPNTGATPLGGDPKNWLWPAQGRVLRGYVANNPSRNGLDIAGKEGQPVLATAAGEVVYSGNGLIGYGELIIVRHSENMLSAYAHNRVRLAGEGDRIAAGQKIAEMGRNAAGEQILHFEIRVRGKPVNPLNYLPDK